METIKDFKYKLIKNFFSEDELNILKLYTDKLLLQPWKSSEQEQVCPFTPDWLREILMMVMLEHKLPKMEEITGLQLFKTYAYLRYYHFGSFLKNHKDRHSCEISVTACIHKTNDWPIIMDGKEIEMEEGDGVIYLGCELEHGRPGKFKGDGMCQLFMHYVDKNGIYKDHKDDRVRLDKMYGPVAADKQISSGL